MKNKIETKEKANLCNEIRQIVPKNIDFATDVELGFILTHQSSLADYAINRVTELEKCQKTYEKRLKK